MTDRFERTAFTYFGRSCMKRVIVWRARDLNTRRGRRRARKSDSGNQRWDVAEASARTIGLRLAIFSCIERNRTRRFSYDPAMRWAGAAKILAIAAGVGAALLALLAFASFRAALSARIDRAATLEARAVRPAAAARLAAELAAHRLAQVSETESRAVAGAFRRAEGDDALEAYRRANGKPELVEEARKALAADRTEPAGDVAFLRAIRGLREEAASLPPLARPEPPASARRAGGLLLGAAAVAVVAGLLAHAAGRSRAP
jgi:hypothetical protein